MVLLSSAPGEGREVQKRNVDASLWRCRAAFATDHAKGWSIRELFSSGDVKDVQVVPDPSSPSDALLCGTQTVLSDREAFQVRYEFVLGADVGFAVRRYSYVISDGKGAPRVRRTGIVEYAKQDGKPILHRVVEELNRVNLNHVERVEFTVQDLSFDTPAESEFTLEGCGVLGVDGAPATSRWPWVAIALVAAVLSFAGIWWARRHGKRQRQRGISRESSASRAG
ncbi:MAG: hypothetical protein NUV77_19320 [Thermoguttaceae bacterium]|nr:hypothetical protein [Thermoguttaceae bacterium]